MSSLRITCGMRGAIMGALLEHKFGEQDKLLEVEFQKLGDDVYKFLYSTALQKKMREALPVGFLPTGHHQRVKFAERVTRVHWGNSRSVAACHQDTVIAFDAHHPFTDRYRDLRNREDALKEGRREAGAVALAVLQSVTTVGKLIEVWPEVKPFVENYLRRAGTKDKLPAVLPAELNKVFGLPIPETTKPKKGKPA